METETDTNFRFTTKRMLELCNDINNAIAAGKIVTLDTACMTMQVRGAIPGLDLKREVHCILHRLDMQERDVVRVMSVKGHYVRAFYPQSAHVSILYDPTLDKETT